MKLYFSPGACSLGIHVLLEEIGKPYETEKADLLGAGAAAPADRESTRNAKCRRWCATTVRCSPSIRRSRYWLARGNPEQHLFPDDLEGQARVLEATDYCVARLHMQGSRACSARGAAPTPAEQESMTARGTRHLRTARWRCVDAMLAGREYFDGTYSFADTALFYCCSGRRRSRSSCRPTSRRISHA